MNRRSGIAIACVLGVVGAAGLVYVVARARSVSGPPDAVVMMKPFVSTPVPAEEFPIEVPTTTEGRPNLAPTGTVAPSGNFAPVNSRPVGVALDTGRDAYREAIEAVRAGRTLEPSAIRLEEWIHAPRYDYAPPARAGEEMAVHLEVAAAPWNPTHRLVRVGLKASPDPAGGRVRQVRAQIAFDPRVVRSVRRLASGEPPVGTGGVMPGPVDFGPDATFTALYEVALSMVEGGEVLGALTLSREITGARRVAGTHEIRDKGLVLLEASEDFRLAAAVAGLGLWLRNAPESGLIDPRDLIRWVGRVEEYDTAGRMEFVALVTKLRARR